MSFCRPIAAISSAIALIGQADLVMAGKPDVGHEPGTLEHAIESTYKIKNERSTATCFLVNVRAAGGGSRLVLVTGGHVLRQAAGEECRLVLRKRSADGRFSKDEWPVPIRAGKKELWVKHPRADVAALPLKLLADRAASAFELSQLAEAKLMKEGLRHTGQAAFVLCYPAQLESHPAGFPVLRHTVLASYPLLSDATKNRFLVDYSALTYDSGGPVIIDLQRGPGHDNGRLLVVGMVIGHHRESTKMLSHVCELSVHRPLGLAIAVSSQMLPEAMELAVGKQN